MARRRLPPHARDTEHIVWDPASGVRVLRSEWEAEQRRRFLGFQVPCPRCGAQYGEPCWLTGNHRVPRRYVTITDAAHHRDRTRDLDWETTPDDAPNGRVHARRLDRVR